MSENRKRMVKIAAGFAAAMVLYAWVSSPGVVAVDERGLVVGLFNELRASLQGDAFWRDQAKIVQKELEWEVGEPERRAQFDKELDRQMEELYRKVPTARPSLAEQRAEALRYRADAIEMAEIEQLLEEDRQVRISMLQKVQARIDDVLGNINDK